MNSQHRKARAWRDLALEVPVVAAAFIAYWWGRGLTEGSASDAIANAKHLIDLERDLGFFWEESAQAAIVDHRWLVTLVNWIYIWCHWPVIAVAAVWLFMRRPATYYLVRNAFLVSGLIGLVVFITFPVAPPRLVDIDVIDTVTLHSHAYRVLQPPGFVNQYAAMPSLHFGWNLLIGGTLAWECRTPVVRVFGCVLPMAMLLAVVLTANHYIIDTFAGAAVALFGMFLARELRNALSHTGRGRPWRFIRELWGVQWAR